jgi:drug/metabolite transporter (DMT)-like permease
VRISRTDALLLALAVCATSTSAPLTREAAIPALAIAFWRNALAAGGLVPLAVAARRPAAAASRRAWWAAVAAGVVLGAHFATWISSLSLTTVAASVVLVSTQPVWAALIARATGSPIGARAWAGVALAVAGVVMAAGVDVGGSSRALRGDGLALVGGLLAAVYVSIGAVARRELSTTSYTAACYTTAAVTVLVAAVVGGQHLTGFGARGWWCILAITVGPQLLGHSVFNRLLRTVGPTTVSVALLGEIVGASLLAAWWFGQRPSLWIVPAAVLIAGGVVLVVRGVAGVAGVEAEVVAG